MAGRPGARGRADRHPWSRAGRGARPLEEVERLPGVDAQERSRSLAPPVCRALTSAESYYDGCMRKGAFSCAAAEGGHA
jgi:hypothetical protein